jgi:hypothetical protein
MTHPIRLIYTSVVAALIRRASIVSSYEHGRAVAVILGAGPPTPPDAIHLAVVLLVLLCSLAIFFRNGSAAG